MNLPLILIGKLFSLASKAFNLGSGSTWPGHIALNINKSFIKEILKANPQLKIILIAGTNGKTTTGKLIQTILENANYRAFQNESGANLLNGIASTLIQYCNKVGKITYDFAIFEVDENTLPLALKEITPDYLLLLNLFRDQLDRYGEVNTIADKWRKAIGGLSKKTKVILNADDPQVTYLSLHLEGVDTKQILFFGLNNKKLATSNRQHASDATYCPNCESKLSYSMVYYSHLGVWKCPNCKNARPELHGKGSPCYPLVGIYNRYNTIAAVLLSKQLGITEKNIKSALERFEPAFGRQEILHINGKRAQIFLSKNPTGFNESLRTIASMKAKTVLLVLNDRIPDGRDVSWIWDVDFEDYVGSFKNVFVSGDRAYDMGLRIKYAQKSEIRNQKSEIETDLKKAIRLSLANTLKSETLYILPTYSAMLEVRKILAGRRIL